MILTIFEKVCRAYEFELNCKLIRQPGEELAQGNQAGRGKSE